MTSQAQRILASTARRGAGIMREVAYTEAAVRISDGRATEAESRALFRARHRFTPGWSTIVGLPGRTVTILETAHAAQDGPGAEAETRRALRATGHWTGR